MQLSVAMVLGEDLLQHHHLDKIRGDSSPTSRLLIPIVMYSEIATATGTHFPRAFTNDAKPAFHAGDSLEDS